MSGDTFGSHSWKVKVEGVLFPEGGGQAYCAHPTMISQPLNKDYPVPTHQQCHSGEHLLKEEALLCLPGRGRKAGD